MGKPVSSTIQRHAVGLLSALATVTLLVWRLDRPALWLDEAATAVATQRTWPNLWLLLQGADAPLVPFYALLKLITGVVTDLAPQAAEHPEWLYRGPSVAAMTLAVWALTVWLGRFAPPALVLATTVVLLATAGLSRYGQEARPYGMVLLATVFATIAWSRLVLDPRKRWLPVYVFAVILLVAANSLAATLIVAHLVAATTAPEPGQRWRAFQRTVLGSVLGALIVAPLVIIVTLHGKGATRFPSLTPESLFNAFVHLFTMGEHPWLGVGALLPLALLGLTRVASAKYRFLTRLVVPWAVVPPVLLLPAVIVRPNLLIGRYLLFVVPAWAILAGLGIVTVLDLGRRVLGPGRIGAAVPALLAGALLVTAVNSQLPSLKVVRQPGGHGEDIRLALAEADRPIYAGLPIFMATRLGTTELGAYDRKDEARLLGTQLQRDQRSIWPWAEPHDLRRVRLRDADQVILLMRDSSLVPACGTVMLNRSLAGLNGCLPSVLRNMRFQVVSADRSGTRWTFVLLDRYPLLRPTSQPPRPGKPGRPGWPPSSPTATATT
jgi:mannosyltransferase